MLAKVERTNENQNRQEEKLDHKTNKQIKICNEIKRLKIKDEKLLSNT